MATGDQIAVIDRRADVARTETPALADSSPGALLRLAIERDLPVEKIQQLMDLQERWEANEARKAYVAAMGDLKRDDCPRIVKDQTVAYKSTRYEHSSLAHVVGQCVSALAKHGFHHDWETAQSDKGTVEVSCVVTHRQGHSTRKTLVAPHDTSGSKNSIQAIASTVTYLERYTLLMALGLAPADDDDGRAAGPPVNAPRAQKPPAAAQRGPVLPPRAKKAIEVWSRYLGDKAQAQMEYLIGGFAGEWNEQDFETLVAAWQVVRGLETAAEKRAALEAEIDRRVAEVEEGK